VTQFSIKTQILRRLPGLRRYYASIAHLNAERVAAFGLLDQARAQLADKTQQLTEERDAALTLAHAHEAERDAALTLARAHEAERDALRSATEGYVNVILQRLSAHHDAANGKLNNLAAGILGVGARTEEAISRLGSQFRGQTSDTSGGRAAELYLDLLEASLTGLLIEDGSQAPWTEGTFDPSLRAIGRDWPEQAITMIGTARMRNLRMLTTRALEEGVPGDFIETGVWRGGACIYAKGIFEAYGATDRKVFVADSFRGLPEPDAAHNPADAGDIHHTYAQLAISRETVAGNFRRYGLLDEQVVFLEGWFKDTLPVAPIDRLAVLRLDGDMYESTMDALNALYHKVSPGGFVIVDDYVLEPCARAIHDFRGQHGIEAPMEPVDGAAVWWRVPSRA